MPLYSAFTCFGHLRFKRGPSRFRIIYDSMRDGQGANDLAGSAYGPNDVHQEARIYAAARCIAVADGQLERAANEGRPLKTQRLLAELERDYGLAPAPADTEAERRDALDLAFKIVRGSRMEALDDALSTLLGSDFVAAVPMKDLVAPPTQWPASPAAAGNYAAGALWRVYTCTEPLTLVGVRSVHLVDMIASQDPLKVGDVVVVDPGHNGLAEAVTVEALVTAPGDEEGDGFTTNHVRITTTKPHGTGVVCTTAPFPNQGSTQRHIMVQVTASCAADPVKRSAINRLMHRIVRGVTTWEIQVYGVAGANQLTLDDPVKGRLNMYVLG